MIDLDDARHYICQDLTTIRTCDMRVSKEQAAENQERILKEASRLIRERGIAGTGVDALTEAAGMTHGSLYSQLRSRPKRNPVLLPRLVFYARKSWRAPCAETFCKVS